MSCPLGARGEESKTGSYRNAGELHIELFVGFWSILFGLKDTSQTSPEVLPDCVLLASSRLRIKEVQTFCASGAISLLFRGSWSKYAILGMCEYQMLQVAVGLIAFVFAPRFGARLGCMTLPPVRAPVHPCAPLPRGPTALL